MDYLWVVFFLLLEYRERRNERKGTRLPLSCWYNYLLLSFFSPNGLVIFSIFVLQLQIFIFLSTLEPIVVSQPTTTVYGWYLLLCISFGKYLISYMYVNEKNFFLKGFSFSHIQIHKQNRWKWWCSCCSSSCCYLGRQI